MSQKHHVYVEMLFFEALWVVSTLKSCWSYEVLPLGLISCWITSHRYHQHRQQHVEFCWKHYYRTLINKTHMYARTQRSTSYIYLFDSKSIAKSCSVSLFSLQPWGKFIFEISWITDGKVSNKLHFCSHWAGTFTFSVCVCVHACKGTLNKDCSNTVWKDDKSH